MSIVPTAEVRQIRNVMPQEGRYLVPTRLLAIALVHRVADVLNHLDDEVHNPQELTPNELIQSAVSQMVEQYRIIQQHGHDLARRIAETVVVDPRLTADALVREIWHVTISELGQRIHVTGWMPGHLTGVDGNHSLVVELTGNVCPLCEKNPTVTRGDRSKSACLNSEECGWSSNDLLPF